MKSNHQVRGRAALSNPGSRFLPRQSSYDAEVDMPDFEEDDRRTMGQDQKAQSSHNQFVKQHDSVKTQLTAQHAKSIIATNRSPDVPFTQSINPYQGCEHGCIYCFARPTHAYWDLSPGLDFETRITYKTNAAELLERELSRPGYRCKPIVLGSNTDPYQPSESKLGITRQLLEVLQRFNHPLVVTTKSQRILRDLDILSAMAAQRLCRVQISITTLDNALMRTLEPRAAAPRMRLETVSALKDAGVPVGVLAAPVIPSINDHELEAILTASRKAGAQQAGYILLRLPLEVKPLFEAWLQQHYPGRARHVMSLLAQCHGGKSYDSRYGQRMRGNGVVADLIAKRFALCCRRLGLIAGEAGAMDCSRFGSSDDLAQMSLF